MKYALQKFHGRYHELVDRYDVSICTMQTNLFTVSQIFFHLLSTYNMKLNEQLGGCFWKKQRMLTLPMHLDQLNSGLLIYFHVPCCVRLYCLSTRFPRIIFIYFWLFFESWFSWYPFRSEDIFHQRGFHFTLYWLV